ncbi:hypothetical protein [Sporolactobacillus terrae]|uniref:ComEC/Rec2-related protein domain-containing protein n=1 Tax=Sporolactobacillus terrae TaxID=269673 RepID=A0ABX5QAR0_9BACL|nr:hypothetical protein [Sporolactobacillus terrae]QAA23758.1 hypothetical protein C0674_14825 [Sporolactobacillus terrae]QAA26729.1 hypothetical protein C0679_14810 [Sporolactobacillus terrae]UAK15792.1 hypothetical protein K7399_12340 [Sporolactobacillus terrae]
MICVPVFLNSIASPIFMYYFLPPMIGIAAAINLILDALIFSLALLFFNVKMTLSRFFRTLIGLWFVNMIANSAASLLLALIGTIRSKYHLYLIDYYTIYSSPFSTISFLLAVLLAGLIIYWLGYFYLKGHFSQKQAARMALVFALLAAPYPFLIPATFFY